MNVKKEVMEREKSYAHQPMLLAFPAGAPKGADLRQISSEKVEEFMQKGYTIQPSFVDFDKCKFPSIK